MRAQRLVQRGERALRKPSFPMENRVRPERADHRQQEAKRRAALAAGKPADVSGHFPDRRDEDAVIGNRDLRAKGVQAGDRRRDIGGNAVAEKLAGRG